MKLKLTWLMTLFMAFVMQISLAQEKAVSGTVTSVTDGLPLPGVNVIVKGTTRGAQTDFDGNYTINVSVGETLAFSFVSMKSTEVIVGASNTINVALEEDIAALEEVVIVGYGTTTKKAYAGTASTISAENIEAKSFSNVTQALAGEVSGVSVVNSSGQPGSVAEVRIRGYGSPLGSRSPLYVVDGIPLAGNFELNSINPSDIKTTTILKDATATAIYGSRGANGVVLITTKTGNSSEQGYVEVDVKTGINQQLIARYDVITNPDEYIGYVWEGLYNRGVVTGNADPVAFANNRLLSDNGIGEGYNMWDATTGGALIDPNTRMLRAGVNRLYTPELYADEAFGTGYRTETNVRMGGGSEKSKYFLSAGYLNDRGYSINSDYKRYTTRLNLSSDVKDWLKVGTNIGYSYSQSTNNGQIDGSENLFEFADKMAPIYPVFARFPNSSQLIADPIYGGFQYDYGSPTGTANGFERNRPNANLVNPIGSAVLGFDGRDTHAINGNLTAEIKFTDDLSFETTFGGQYSSVQRNIVTNHVYGTGAGSNGTIDVIDDVRYTMSFLQLLRYKKSFGNHEIEALAAHETFEQRFSRARAFKQNVVIPGLYNLDNYLESAALSDGYEDGSGLESYFGQLNYNYAGKYYLTGSLRTDGSSRFVEDQWGVFGSIGAAWILSEESFLDDSIFTFLKAKASYGVTGDQQGVQTYFGFDTFNANFVGGGLAIDLRAPGSRELTWETSKMLQGGLEMSLGNFLDVNIDYYRKNTDNLFFNQRVGPSNGLSSIRVNDGEILNAGLEFDVTGHILKSKDFSLDLSINGEILENKMVKMPIDASNGLPKIIDSNSSEDGAYAFAEGRSIFDFYMREWAGVDPTDGAPTWYQYYDDANNNDVLDAGEGAFVVSDGSGGNDNTSGTLYEYTQKVSNTNIKKTVTKTYASSTQVFIGKSFIPDLRGAFRLSARIKSFDFSTQFTYSLGGYAYDAQYSELMSDRFGAAGNNFHKDIANRWQQPGDVTDVPILSDNAVVNGTSQSTRFIISTDYIALNNARIGYTLPTKFVERAGLDTVNLWVSGDNLFVKTARDGFNPSIREVGNSERAIYAPATTITIGARVKF
ncbi:TonB-linked SusC/RagA family outer membrane protein [Gelidibacter algens]|uniref:TonB-linked SusC/RagA family outer membrane protein n=1 Tax=Gelidibacter algens TaxID=49280 RepID=A0A1A7R645_9FLAO|nr:SusC/RagA family TonB-linked outer membrane protein [Gelidibacter algens]OBX26222.1 SusC/RagA family TonB-linked outer membrane protein [Gelidibacter algens]RAJ22452.1 TonB-linked SusC/RagA family outer membrane protein [Gelidibacter algens]